MTVMLRAFLSGSCVCCVMAAASGGRAQEFDGPAPVNTTASLSAGADEDIQIQPRNAPLLKTEPPPGHPLGTYAGVVPGASSAPAVPVAKTETKPMITWPGFQMRQDGTSRVFIQSTTALTPQPSAAGPRFSVYLPGAKVAGNTNKLPLETRFFNTPVSRVNIEQQRDGVTLVLDLRAEISPVVSSERGPTGYYFLYIDLPKGTFVKTPAPAQTAADVQPAPDHGKETSATAKPAPVQAQASAHGRVEGEASAHEAKASTRVEAKGGIRLGP
jgi:hypothetical protein